MANEKIYVCLWADGRAEEQANFYVDIFPNSKIERIDHYPSDPPGMSAGDVSVIDFRLLGQRYRLLNGGPRHPYADSASITVECDDQAELDSYWDALRANGGKEVACGWVQDRFGLSWQIVPKAMEELTKNGNAQQAKAVFEAMMGMVKLDIGELEKAFANA